MPEREPSPASLAAGRILLLFQPGLDFTVAFFACLAARLVAFPAYPPRRAREDPPLYSIVRDARPALVLTTSAVAERVERMQREPPEPWPTTWVAMERLPLGDRLPGPTGLPTPAEVAIIQYTSGSTGSP